MRYLFLLFTFLTSLVTYSQSASCVGMEPICTNSGLTFTAQTGVGIGGNGANNYGCLGSQPNPSWYYLEIATSGAINMSLSAPSDIDFIVYGPYSTLTAAQNDCGNLGSPAGEIIDCSFSFTNNETPSIPNAVAGQVYVMLITNYANTVQQVTLNQTSGSGSTDCTIINPVCSITNFTANIGACVGGVYGVTGTINFVDPPTSGSLIVEDCDGNTYTVDTYPFPNNGTVNYTLNNLVADGNPCNLSVYFSADPTCELGPINYTAPVCLCSFTSMQTNISACNPTNNSFTISGSVGFVNPPATGTLTISDCNGNTQTFNAPFTSPTNYSLTANSDGTQNCSVTAVFSANPACTITSNTFNYPNGCVCESDAGTFNENLVGNSNSIPYTYNLCFGDTLFINSNGDFTPPQDFNIAGITYDPGMWLMVYNCPPSATPPTDINTDPCLLGVYSSNDQSWVIPNNTGNNSTLYFVPVTMYSMVDGIYAVSINGGNWCYDLGDMYTVTFLPQLVVNAGPDQTHCFGQTTSTLTASGASTYVWSGGLGTNPSITVSPTTTTTYTVTGTSINGCVDSDQVVVNVNPLPVINAGPDQSICIGATITLSGSGGNTYTWDNGVVNGSPFAPTATMTYTVTGTSINGCVNTDQVTVTVNPLPTINAGTDQTICIGSPVTLNGSGGSTYTWNNGVINNTPFNPTVTNTYTVTGTSVNGCVNTDQVVVTVNPLPNISAGPDQTLCFNTTTTLNGSGGNTYTWNNGVVNGSPFTPQTTMTYTVTGTDINGCTNTDQVTITINPLPNVNAGPDQEICDGDSVILTAIGATNYTWNNGVTNGNTFYPNTTLTYTVTGTNAQGCTDQDLVIVVVNPIPVVNAGVDVQVCDGETVVLTGSGADAYTWNNSVTNGVSFIPSVGSTTYTVVGETVEGCENIDSVVVFVSSNPAPVFTPSVTSGCAPLTVTFTNNTSDSQGCVWNFSNGQNSTSCNPTVTFTQGGCYDVMLTTTNSNGCIGSSTFTNLICVEDLPNASFIPSSGDVSTLGTEVDFTNTTTGASNYVWSFGDESQSSNVINPTHIFPDSVAGEYQVTLIAYSPMGCTDTTWTYITVYEELIYYVPNTFTPDGDKFNQTFKPIFTSGFDVYDYNLQIYNRWGELIFESNNHTIGWDGSYGSNGEISMCQDGTYVWRIEFKLNRWDERRVIHGHVNLIR